MNAEAKKKLLDTLTEVHSTTREALEGIDPEMRVYTDSDWRVRDILGHLATWDREVAKSVRAFLAGSEYFISDLEENDYNERAVQEQSSMTSDQVYAEWEQAHEELKGATQDISLDQFHGEMLYPWGNERGDITVVVGYMCEHDVEHREEILKAFQAAGGD
jgi:hypothetical protein